MNKAKNMIIHQDDQFRGLIKKLRQLSIIDFQEQETSRKILINHPEILSEIFRVIFILYTNPKEKIKFFSDDRVVILEGQWINLSITETLSEEANEILNFLITQETDNVYELAFNSLIAIYLGSLGFWDFLYPNTYIIELGKDTHEIDIFGKTQDQKYVMIETTRGFDKKTDKIDESYLWHFKKAIFRKWMIEKLYTVECQLYYITLKGLEKKELPSLDESLSKEAKETNYGYNELIDKILAYENNKVRIIDLQEDLKKCLKMSESEKIIHKIINNLTI